MGVQLSAFFENAAFVWIVGALLVFARLFIIANHQYWSSASGDSDFPIQLVSGASRAGAFEHPTFV
jgi:hypothetical protein